MLAESEFFGHEKGAFTGAVGRKRGLLELAEGGTLLLNEIGELPLPLQVKLLTFLDTRQFNRVGGEKEILVNARLLFATNKDLQKEVEADRFRKDLYYRISKVSISIPPLRERRDDIPVLVAELIQKIKLENQLNDVPPVTPQIMEMLKQYDWPGNVRELEGVLEQAMLTSGGREIILDDKLLGDASKDTQFCTLGFPPTPSLDQVIEEVRDKFMQEAMRQTGNNKKRAADLLHISRFKVTRHRKKT